MTMRVRYRAWATLPIATLCLMSAAAQGQPKKPPRSCAGSKFRPANPNGSVLQTVPRSPVTKPALDDEIIGARDASGQSLAEAGRKAAPHNAERYPSC